MNHPHVIGMSLVGLVVRLRVEVSDHDEVVVALRQPRIALLEPATGGLHPGSLDIAGRRDPKFTAEDAREVARAHRHPPGEGLDAEVRVGMRVDPDLQVGQGGTRREGLEMAPRTGIEPVTYGLTVRRSTG